MTLIPRVTVAAALAEAFSNASYDLPSSCTFVVRAERRYDTADRFFRSAIKNIRLGPTLPPSITPNVLGVLVD